MSDPATTPPPTDTPQQHALTLANLGLRVIPIRAGSKRPPMNSWQHAATNNPDKIRNWYNGLYRNAGVGIALGTQPNGTHLFALDCDDRPDGNGADELHELEQQHGKLPDTWQAITGAGNQHHIYKTPPGITVRNQQAGGNRVAPNIDIRGQGGQIVVAPTIHPDTLNAYHWEHGHEPWTIPVAEAPDWLIHLVKEPDPTPPPTSSSSSSTDDDGEIFQRHKQDWHWRSELLNRGWTHCGDQNNDSYWARPGKDRRAGHSAVLHEPDGPLIIFTTEIDPTWTQAATRTQDGSGWALSAFGFYAATQHHGNRSQAAKALHERYGTTPDNLTDLLPTNTDTDTPDDEDRRLLDMLINWDEFADTDFKTESWLWEPVIPESRAVSIFAKGGTGKSLVILRMVIDLCAAGRRILYLDYEMTPDDLDDRLADMGIDNPRTLHGNLHYALLPSLDAFDTPEGGKQVRRLAQLVNAELVIIDTFARAVQGDENDADTVRDFYRLTGLHLKADGRAFLRADHAGKDPGKGQRGTSAKNDDVDLVWDLRRTETGYKLIRGKCRMGWVPEAVNLERTDHPLTLKVTGNVSYPPGTNELAAQLDQLNIDEQLTDRKVRPLLKDAGIKAANNVLRAAIRYRQNRSQKLHFVDDLIAHKTGDNSVDNIPAHAPAHQNENPSGASSGAPNPKNTKPQVDDPRRTLRRTAAHTPDTSPAQCAPLKGAHGDECDPWGY